MTNLFLRAFLFLFSVGVIFNSSAQTYSLQLEIKNQPQNQILFGTLKGDKFNPIDTTQSLNGIVKFQLSANISKGMYRLILGQTTYARIMNEPPQQLDFIFNYENIIFKTDFKAPADSLEIIQSVENKLWFDFIKKEKELKEKQKEVEMELDYFREKGAGVSNSGNAITNYITQFNYLQQERDKLITKTINENPNLFASKLIKMYREPFLDGTLTKQNRNKIFKDGYFKNLDFTDETIINSAVYTDKIFNYLMNYAQRGLNREQQEKEFKKASDIILTNTNQNEKVYEFILDYLVRGFEKLNLDNLITYIADNYSGTTCQTDEVTTLERKLEAQKMKVGTTVSDFTINDINGDPITLSDVLKERNLILFWASWCPHCLEMLPQIKQWQKQAKNSNVEIFAISLDTDKKDWKKIVFELGTESWHNLSDFQKWDSKVAIDYNIFATPTLFIVDKNLQIIGKAESFYELNNIDIF